MSELDRARVQAELTTAALGRSLELKAITESTNDDARRAAARGAAHGHVIVADAQTRGRGSRGRNWDSPAQTDLYLSVVAHVVLPAAQLPPLTLAVGLAVAETVEALLPDGPGAEVKWPNDVWVARRKVAGVLVEAASSGPRLEPLVIGVGLNVNRLTFPDELASSASSIARERGANVDRSRALALLLNVLEPWLDRFMRDGPAPAVEALNARLALRGERASCGDLVGVVVGVASSGALLLATDDGLRECSTGTLRPCDLGACEGAREEPA